MHRQSVPRQARVRSTLRVSQVEIFEADGSSIGTFEVLNFRLPQSHRGHVTMRKIRPTGKRFSGPQLPMVEILSDHKLVGTIMGLGINRREWSGPMGFTVIETVKMTIH